MNSNMYYAINRTKDLCFRISKKKLSKKMKKKTQNNNNKDSLKVPVKSPTDSTTFSFQLNDGPTTTTSVSDGDVIKLTSYNVL